MIQNDILNYFLEMVLLQCKSMFKFLSAENQYFTLSYFQTTLLKQLFFEKCLKIGDLAKKK